MRTPDEEILITLVFKKGEQRATYLDMLAALDWSVPRVKAAINGLLMARVMRAWKPHRKAPLDECLFWLSRRP